MEACPGSRANRTAATLPWSEVGPVLVKSAALTTLLVVIVASNVVVIHKVTRRGRKWTASDKLLKTLASVGILNGLVNVSTYLVTTCTGRWVLGGTLCQLHGVFGTVIINAWTWILALAAFERFVKLLVPSEHASFFSEVNTKIMTWGTVLLLLVMYLGPVYGWGEYSFYRGKLDLAVGFRLNSTSPPGDQQAALGYLAGLTSAANPLLTATMLNLTHFFEISRQISLRRPHLTPQGLVLPMRASTRGALQCLWAEFEAGLLTERLQGIVAPNATLSQLGVPLFEVDVAIRREQYLVYSDVHIPYQESATCSLDYSNVNEHVYSFVGFTWLCNLAMPFVLMAYCYCRVFYAGVHKLCMFSRDGVTPEDAVWCRVFAYTGFASMLCHLPSVLTNLAAGCGFYVPANVHFVATYLVYLSACLLACFYLCSTRSSADDYDEAGSSCCGVLACFSMDHAHLGMLGEIHQRLLSRPGSATNSPYKPRTPRHAASAAKLTTNCNVNETEL